MRGLWRIVVALSGLSLTAAWGAEGADSNSVLGANPQLADGTQAMLNGDWQRGIDLILLGLADTVSVSDRAVGLANLCAAHAALKQCQKGLEFCDQSLAVQDNNWRTWQNRAACHLGLGNIEESLQDLQRGLALNPDADALQKTLAIAREREKEQRERLQQLIES